MIERQDEPASQTQVLWNGMMMQGKRNVLLMAIGGGWLSLFMAGLLSYQGSLIIYLVFSAGYLLLLLSAFRNQSTYVYVYLAILLWLGFWLKVTFHYLFSHPFVEPAGRFTETAATWDEVLLVATSAAVGVYISRILFQLLSGNGQSIFGTNADVPGWLTTYGTWHLAAFLCGLVVFTVANIYFGIFVIGFEVRTILPWPLNALITLMLVGGGFVVWAASMTWWRMLSGRRLFLTLLAMIVCGTLITFSTLSRGGVVFFTLPILYAVYFNRKMIPGYSTSKAILVLVIFGLAVASSFLAVNQIRDRLYYHKPPTTSSPTTSSPTTSSPTTS